MALRLSTGCRKKLMDTSSFDALFALSFIDIYSGAQPSSPDDVPNGTKLATITKNSDDSTGLSWEASAPAGALVKSTSETWGDPSAAAAGTAGWFRLREAGDAGTASSTTAVRIDGTIATSGADMNLGSLTIALGAPIVISAATFTMPSE